MESNDTRELVQKQIQRYHQSTKVKLEVKARAIERDSYGRQAALTLLQCWLLGGSPPELT